MMTISESDFRKLDLNLLRAFQALVREKSVSRAADRLYLGQPAMSGALARLRDIFHDEILVRTGRGMEPTTKALALHSQLAPAMESIRTTLLEQPVFDPATQFRTYHLGMRDWVEALVMPALLARVQEAAPWVQISVRASNPHEGAHMLANEEMDLGVSVFDDGPPWLRREQLAVMRYRCVYDGNRLGIGSPLTLEQYVAHPHLVTSTQTDFRDKVDAELAAQGKQRRVTYATARYGAMPLILRRADFIATIPEQSAQQWTEMFGLTSSVVPVQIPPFDLSMIWHAKRDGDAGIQWLRGIVRSVVARELVATSTPARKRRGRAQR